MGDRALGDWYGFAYLSTRSTTVGCGGGTSWIAVAGRCQEVGELGDGIQLIA